MQRNRASQGEIGEEMASHAYLKRVSQVSSGKSQENFNRVEDIIGIVYSK